MGSSALIIVHPEGGERIVHQGWEATIKLGAEDTGGAFAMIETRFDAGEGPDAHVHSRESETWMVLEGTVEFRLGDERVDAGAGWHCPRAGPHGPRLHRRLVRRPAPPRLPAGRHGGLLPSTPD